MRPAERPSKVTVDVERFMRHVVPVTESGCWLWAGVWNTKGYGIIQVNHYRYAAHRIAYELFTGPIPEGLQIDHLCRVRCCVNPVHLEVVTSRENTLRGMSPQAQLARQTHCKYGHPLAGDNLLRLKNPRLRACRACNKRRLAIKEERLKKIRALRRATQAAQDAGAKLPAWVNEAMRLASTQTNPPHPTEERS